ncbi:family 20 glycosylhydrolase [Phycicoccus sonneratiae]|uniref:Family 20 glycosylhydrolase n=1 Tax=Phycicoccus sonneratiae TaxID=2807628 RepID=A0ABS2CJG0_9MICO|nr:family 20 glycosylhydrolase [Phycicoccus sonneraticus]MBM6400027.1 family 20 glycosylhydrolase [Phycicoccus sonneraticus]
MSNPHPLSPTVARRVVLGGLAAAAVVARPVPAGAAPSAAAGGGLPPCLPGLRCWTPGSGTFTLATAPTVRAPVTLAARAAALAGDLTAVLGRPVGSGSGAGAAGDVVLSLGSGLDDEEYELTVGSTLRARATTSTGLSWAAQTVLQLLRRTTTLPRGTVSDGPVQSERALMVDLARQFYPLSWVRDQVRQMAYLKLNTLHLHLSDDQAFRVESTVAPDAVSADHYSKAELQDLVGWAAQQGVTVVPEIDVPGHMGALLAARPGIALAPVGGTRRVLDLSQQSAWDFAESVLREYLPLLDGPTWMLGNDEWLSTAEVDAYPGLGAEARRRYGAAATGRDLQYDFVNHMAGVVAEYGKGLRIWNDQIVPSTVVPLSPEVSISHWYGSDDPTARQLADRGHDLVNANWLELYYILGNTPPSAGRLWDTFSVGRFALRNTESTVLGEDDPHLLGAQLSVWGEPGVAVPPATVAANVRDPLRVLAQLNWGSPRPAADYAGFAALSSAVGDAPPR